MPFVYILQCSDGSFYVGHTNDVAARERVHNEGFGPRYTANRRPVHVVYSERHETLEDAVARERQLKRWSGRKKAALVDANRASLKLLSRCRTQVRKISGHSQRELRGGSSAAVDDD